MREYHKNTRIILVAKVDGAVLFYDLGEKLSLNVRDRDQSDRYERIGKDWSRFKVRDVKKLEGVIARHYPKWSRIDPVEADPREEINRLLIANECVLRIKDYQGGGSRITGTALLDAAGKQINRDGVLLSECDNEGKPYPKAGPGEQRYRVSIKYTTGASNSAYHVIYVAKTPKEAVEAALAWNDNPENPFNKVNAQGIIPSQIFRCDREEVAWASAVDIDSGATVMFNGPDLTETEDTRKINKAFDILARYDTDPGAKDEMASLLAEAMASSMGGMRRL